jgi:16S rRNA (guanine527-N7)-methyltransferase
MPRRTTLGTDPASHLEAGASRLGIRLTPDQRRLFMGYLEELLRWNRRINLVAPQTEGEAVETHFLDSLLYRRGLPSRPHLRVLDVGTGAGFPGIPLQILDPSIRLTLLEASRKKAAFLHHLCGRLGLSGITILNRRIESLGPDPLGGYDVVLWRALAPPAQAIELCLPFVAPHGRLVLSLGPRTPEPRSPSVRRTDRIEARLPFSGAARILLVLEPAG